MEQETKKEKILNYLYTHHQHFNKENKIIQFIKNIFKIDYNWYFKDDFPYVESLELENFIIKLYKDE